IYSDEEMQHIAKEINFSETTFIMSDSVINDSFPVRIFTPAEEMPFAGHPTLGTTFIIQQKIICKQVPSLTLDLKIGKIPVTFEYINNEPDKLTMRQIEPIFGKVFAKDELSCVLGIKPEDIDDSFPIEETSTGKPDIIVPLKSLDAVRRCQIDIRKYYELINNLDSKAILVFARETYHKENQLNARMFANYFGIPEDPATGSSNGALAGYLVKNRYFDTDKIDIRVEQGYEIGRPSLLYLNASDANGKIDIRVGGKVIEIAKGEWK
ncbi:MAG: PhzF family phenazine biosynthesis protein, partial [candidate division Zixibacteria bacterium]|nr:PhzF family phenazine biosynthesis protein [candidate division Zixibacteria bacterium]